MHQFDFCFESFLSLSDFKTVHMFSNCAYFICLNLLRVAKGFIDFSTICCQNYL